jgi:hypothetical protein
MSKIDPRDDPRAAIRQERMYQAAAVRQMVKEARASDVGYNTDDQRHSAFGRLLAWLRRGSPGG